MKPQMQSVAENTAAEVAEQAQRGPLAGPSRIVVTFEAAGDGLPLPIRLRRLLKSALRSSGLRAINVKELQ